MHDTYFNRLKTLQLALISRNRRLAFNEHDHKYYLLSETRPRAVGRKQLQSVTSFIHRFSSEFNAQECATRVAERRGCSVEHVLAEWEEKRDVAAVLGHNVHAFAEDLANSVTEHSQLAVSASAYAHLGQRDQSMIKAVIRFYLDHPEVMTTYSLPEVRVYDSDYPLAGTIDLICEVDGIPTLVDWKTSARIDVAGYEKMLPPVSHMNDCNLAHYNLQLSLYRWILAKNYGYHAERLMLVWLKPSGHYNTFVLPYREKEVKDMLEHAAGQDVWGAGI